jgi:hypothetical protein
VRTLSPHGRLPHLSNNLVSVVCKGRMHSNLRPRQNTVVKFVHGNLHQVEILKGAAKLEL